MTMAATKVSGSRVYSYSSVVMALAWYSELYAHIYPENIGSNHREHGGHSKKTLVLYRPL